MKKVLYLTTHRKGRSPSQRFRIEQYIDFLEENGYKYDFSNLLTEYDDQIFYSNGNYIRKAFLLARNVRTRFRDILRADKYDLIFIQRRGFLLGTTFFERQIIKKSKAKVIYDFDDAVWIHQVSDSNKYLGWLKNPDKTKSLIKCADLVFAGNDYLANFANQYNNEVKIVPTTIDTDKYIPQPEESKDNNICIGWSGSFSTIKHFESALEPLKVIKEKYDNVEFEVIGDGSYRNKELGIEGIPWREEDEVKEISSFDIGIMPLPDEEWTKGKCGLKGLQYMALEVPAIMSAVGVNKEIINDGENGFLAKDKEEWIDKLSRLIESEKLRKKIGEKGRETVVEKYSVKANKNLYLNSFDQLT